MVLVLVCFCGQVSSDRRTYGRWCGCSATRASQSSCRSCSRSSARSCRATFISSRRLSSRWCPSSANSHATTMALMASFHNVYFFAGIFFSGIILIDMFWFIDCKTIFMAFYLLRCSGLLPRQPEWHHSVSWRTHWALPQLPWDGERIALLPSHWAKFDPGGGLRSAAGSSVPKHPA